MEIFEGPAHFAPVYVAQLRPGMIADFERLMTGEPLYREITAVRWITSQVCSVEIAGMGKHPMHAYGTLRVAGTDAVTQQRIRGQR